MLLHIILMPYNLNMAQLRHYARRRGYRGIAGLLRSLGLHRNTLNRFAHGAGVLPKSVEMVLAALQIPLQEAIQNKRNVENSNLLPILPLIEQLGTKFSRYSFVLFGSRARGRSRKYSDFDIGVIADSTLPFSDYSKMLELKEEFEARSPFFVDLVDLSHADKDFINSVSQEAELLSGKYSDLLKLQQRAQHAAG